MFILDLVVKNGRYARHKFDKFWARFFVKDNIVDGWSDEEVFVENDRIFESRVLVNKIDEKLNGREFRRRGVEVIVISVEILDRVHVFFPS